MRKRLLTVLEACMALVVALALPTLAATTVYQPVESFGVSGFPGGMFTKPSSFDVPSVDDPEYSIPPTFGLQLVPSQTSQISLAASYDTSWEVDGGDLIFTYTFRASDLLDYSNCYIRFFFDESKANMQRHTYSLKINGSNLSGTLGTEADMHAILAADQTSPIQDYWRFSLDTPSGQLVTSAQKFRALGSDQYSMLTSSVFHPNAAMYQYTFTLRVGDALNDYSIDDVQVEDVDSLFDALDDMSLAPAAMVLAPFWSIPFIRYGMIGLGVVAVYCFIVRLF